MRPEEYQMLHTACQAVAKSDPELQQSQEAAFDESAKSIEAEISGFLGAVRQDRKNVFKSAEQALQPLKFLYELALLQVCDLSFFGLKNFGYRRRLIWPALALPNRPAPNAVFYVMASNLAQTMQAFELLILHGFESQARGTFRSVVEMADLMITVLASEDKYREYLKSYEDPKESYKHWRTNLSPSVIRAFLAKLEIDDPITIPIDMTATEIRADSYSWLSNFVHVNFAAHVVAAHPQNLEGTFGKLAMLGTVGEMSRATLAHSLVYLWISLLRLEQLLFEKHNWGSFRGDRSRKWFRYRFRVIDSLFLAYLPTYWEN